MPRTPAGSDRRRLRILYPASLTMGGAERQMLLLAEHLPRDRFDVSFLMLGGWTTNADLAVETGAHVHALGAGRRKSTPMPIFALRVSRRTLTYIEICRRERYDIVDAWLYLSYGIAAVTRPMTRVPVLITGRRSLSGFKESFGPIERAVDAIARRASDLIVANSMAVADDVARREGIERTSIRIIHNGVVIPGPMAASDRRAIRASWGLPEDAFVVGGVGSLKRGKGQERVVELMPDLLARSPDARLVLVGDGPLRADIEGRLRELGLADRVVLTGDVNDARPLYGAFDILVSASDAEGLPNAVLEAAAAGIAIVATDAGGTREIVRSEETGILVPVDDQAALATAVSRLALDGSLRARVGSASRDFVGRTFGLDRFVSETAALYEEMAMRRGIAQGGAPHRPT